MVIEKGIITIKELLEMENLKIPDYQRPYKWKAKNVNQLIDDILAHKNKNGYRLGTLVIHKDKDNENNKVIEIFNIVDGQQRVITIFLLAYCLNKKSKVNFSTFLSDNNISNDIS